MTDVFRRNYKPLNQLDKDLIDSIKADAETLLDRILCANDEADYRMIALAKTNLEQAVMWAIKAIT